MIGMPIDEEKQYRMVENFYMAYCAYCKEQKKKDGDCIITACDQFKKVHA
jgi:hypothetical protein